MTEHKADSDHCEGFQTETEQLDKNLPESHPTMLIAEPEQKSQTDMSEFNDEFVPGTMCKYTLASTL